MSAEEGDKSVPAATDSAPRRRTITLARSPAVAEVVPEPEAAPAQQAAEPNADTSVRAVRSAWSWLVDKARKLVGLPGSAGEVTSRAPTGGGGNGAPDRPPETVMETEPVAASAPAIHVAPLPLRANQPAVPVSPRPRRGARESGAGARGPQRSQESAARLDAEFAMRLAAASGQARPVYVPAPRAPVTLNFASGTTPRLRVALRADDHRRLRCPAHAPVSTMGDQPMQGERELVIGLDFGTSSVKVVIADRSTGHAYAVPFGLAQGLDRYLLPSRVHQSASGFQLDPGPGGTTHRDLKLGLLSKSDEMPLLRSAAFLALVLRHVRNWFLGEHGAAYRQSRLRWSMRLGQPAATNLAASQAQVFRMIGLAAWVASFGVGDSLPVDSVERALDRARALESGAAGEGPAEDIELKVVPEIAAQVYGVVQSRSFDPRARNLYLMVDVGAGTVDAAIFHVKKATGGKWDFEFYTCTVQPHGTMNLHRARLDWWSRQLADTKVGELLADDIAAVRFSTDQATVLPSRVADYVEGAQLGFSHEDHDPDATFFNKVVSQVLGETYWRAGIWIGKEGYLSQADLTGLPAFLCGGGARMPYYRRLTEKLKKTPGFTFLKAVVEPLTQPEQLEAPDLAAADYDRLSVAYGLSFLDVGDIGQGLPLPRLQQKEAPNWQHGYPGHGNG